MTRVTSGASSHSRHRKIIKSAKAYFGRRKNTFRAANQAVEKAGQYSYRDRKKRKRNFRSLWIQRINAAARLNGINYANFMNGLSKANIEIDRKVLSDIAISDPETFKDLVNKATSALK